MITTRSSRSATSSIRWVDSTHRPGMLGVVGEQPVVEELAGDRVQAGVGLVEQRHLGPGGQADHDAQGRAHPPGELLDRPVGREVEVARAAPRPARCSSWDRTTTPPAGRGGP